MTKATFAAGCFWGVEAAFRRLPGVHATQVGYTGGITERPTYRQVCSGETGHAEALQVEYDPGLITYDALLDVFWAEHNPTIPQDAGDQYRSAIFYHTTEQRDAALASRQRLQDSGRYQRPVATQISPVPVFYRAEEYHQRYLEKQR